MERELILNLFQKKIWQTSLELEYILHKKGRKVRMCQVYRFTHGEIPVHLFLAHQIEQSYVLPHVRNSHLTLVILPQAHPEFKCSFLTLVVEDIT